ncbi:MAG: DUF3426 domain-containing protein [Betaproteobacteria bacterium]|nr:MAG: DUF3426 domain-containing protein [Betaproteobacteria bacterium]
MSMVTSCPACTTTFRVSQEQLTHRQGKVRCGKCRSVFDAFKSLATLPDESAPESGPESPPDVAVATAAAPTPRQGSLDIDASAAIPASGVIASLGQADSTGSSPRRLLWLAAIVVLALLLALQLAYALRDPISAGVPALRPALERMCAVTGCTVSPPRRSEQLAIESSDLQADRTRPNVIVLMAVLRNRGDSIVAYPAMELTLTDSQDQALVRRIFLPADYLREGEDAPRGMAALAEVSVRLELDTGELRPAGYRLFLFYP